VGERQGDYENLGQEKQVSIDKKYSREMEDGQMNFTSKGSVYAMIS